MPKAFIPAITGAQSQAIAEALRSAGWDVEGSSRTDEGDPYKRAANADLLVMTVPQDHRPGVMSAFVDEWTKAAIEGEIGRVLLNVGGTPGPAEAHPFFAELHAMEHRVAGSGLPYVILRPTVYLDNLAAPWAADGLAAGTIAYPAAPDAEVSWMSHRTLGAWVVAVASGAADGETLSIGGSKALTGAALAQEIGAGMGRALTYQPIPPEGFAQGMNAVMGAPAGDRLASIYSWLESHPFSMRVDGAEAKRLGVPLETAREFAARTFGSA